MRILILNSFGENRINDVNHIPRVGEQIDWDRIPTPRVTNVLNYPSQKVMEQLGIEFIDAIITVD